MAWNEISIQKFPNDEAMIKRLYYEIELLSKLKKEHIIDFHHSWTDTQKKTLNFITEASVSGSFRDYRRKHRHLLIITVKKWCRG